MKTGTILPASHISVQRWLFAVYLMGISTKSISSIQLSRELGITQKSAWYMPHKIRECYDYSLLLLGVVEIDETYIGGSEKKQAPGQASGQSAREKGKFIVMGLKERTGKVQGRVIDDHRADTLQAVIEEHVAEQAKVLSEHRMRYGHERPKGRTDRHWI